MKKQRRWMASAIATSKADMPALPFQRAARRARLTERSKLLSVRSA